MNTIDRNFNELMIGPTDVQTLDLLDHPKEHLIAQAAKLRDAGHGRNVSYSRKVFIPLTQLCRERLSLLHVCQSAKKVEIGLSNAGSGFNHCARRTGSGMQRGVIHFGRQTRASL